MTLKDVLTDALKNNYAIGAFNFVNLEMLKAIVSASKETGMPAICAVSEGGLKYMGEEATVNLFKSLKKDANVFLHLDHGKDISLVKRMIDLGFDSVMIDASDKSFEENVFLTKEIVKYAHSKNVLVEAELGTLAGVEDNVSAEKNIYTNPQEALKFVQETNVDFLAIAIGTSHGAYKFNGDAKLNIQILSEIETLIPNTPLVLHGASSVPESLIKKLNTNGGNIKGAKGISDQILKEVCAHNICKINTDTDLRIAFTYGVRKHLNENPDVIDIRKYLGMAMEEVKNVVIEKMKLFKNQ